MKRLFTMLAMVFTIGTAEAQIISTTSNTGVSSRHILTSIHTQEGGDVRWFVKAGVNYSGLQTAHEYDNIDGDRSLGYAGEIGFNKQIARSPFYYGMMLGACSNLGSKYTDAKSDVKEQLKEFSFNDGDPQHNIYFSPVNLGICINLGVKLDIGVGAFYTVEYLPEFDNHDWGFNANAGLWLGPIYIGAQAQRGMQNRTEDDLKSKTYLSNVMLRLGVGF